MSSGAGSKFRSYWLLLLDGNEFINRSTEFRALHRRDSGAQIAELQSATDYGITVRAELSLADDADYVEIRCEARNSGSRTIVALNYPRLAGIGPLVADGAANHLLHPCLGGALVRDPFTLFSAGSSVPDAEVTIPAESFVPPMSTAR